MKNEFADYKGCLVRIESQEEYPEHSLIIVLATEDNMLASRTYVFSKLLKKVELKDLPLYLDREYKSEEFMRLFGATSSF
jgi:hypothetical protein